MTEGLVTRHAFVDTQVFVAANFQYKGDALSALVDKVKAKKIQLYITSITLEEVKAQILENLSTAKAAIKELKKNGRILRNSTIIPFDNIFKKLDEQTVKDDLMRQLEEFINKSEITILSPRDVDVEDVFVRYFNSQAPFSGKKKHEFPDAFTISCLKGWCLKNNQKMYVISGDNDIKEACDKEEALLYLSKIEELLDLITLDDRNIKNSASLIFQNLLPSIKEQIIGDFENLGFIIEDREGEVESIRIRNIENEDAFLLKVTDSFMFFDAKFLIEFHADVHYFDPSSSYYDSEEGLWLVKNYEDITLEDIEVDIETIIQIEFDRQEIRNSKLFLVTIKDDFDIEISIDDGYPYK